MISAENHPSRAQTEEVNVKDIQYYHTKRCTEAGEEYDSELKRLDSESESSVDNDGSSGRGSGVLEGSSGEYFACPSVRLEFVHLEEGMCQMLEVVTGMSETVLSDQEPQGSKKSAWKTVPVVETAIPKWTEYWANDEMCFFLSDDRFP